MTLSGTIGGSATSGVWSIISGGNGSLSVSTLSGSTVTATYTPDPTDELTTIVFQLETNDPDGAGPCVAVNSLLNVAIDQAAEVSAGSDAIFCETDIIGLNGSFGGSATSVTWSGGLGSFSNVNDPLATYTADASEIGTTVTLTLTTDDPSGPCSFESDDVNITINEAATVSVVPDFSACEDGPVTLSGTIGGSATTGTWTIVSGGGTLSGSVIVGNTVTAIYTPVSSDALTTTIFQLETNDPDGIGPCASESALLNISIEDAAEADAGIDQTICQGDAAPLLGIVGGSVSTGTWSGGLGTFVPDASTLNAQYIPDASEVGSSVLLTLMTADPVGVCNPVSDQVLINITPAATANAGSDEVICDNEVLNLSQSITLPTATNFSSLLWTTLGSGTFSDPSVITPIYTPSLSDITSGTVELILTVQGNGPCPSVEDTLILTINPVPTIDPVSDIIVCPGEIIPTLDFTTDLGSGTFSWIFDDAAIVGAGSGTGFGSIPSFVAADNFTTGNNVSQVRVSNSLNGCISDTVSFNIVVLPQPIINSVTNISGCPGEVVSQINFANNLGAGAFDWTVTNSAEIGLGIPSGSGPIPTFNLATNNTGASIISTVTVTSTVSGCISDTLVFTIENLPTPITIQSDLEFCDGDVVDFNFIANTGGSETFAWTNSNTAIGLTITSDVGDIPSFIAVNNTNAPVVSNLTVMATLSGCPGPVIPFTITVQPEPSIIPSDLSGDICSGESVAFVPSSVVSLTQFLYEPVSVPSGLLGATSGVGNINDTLINTTNVPLQIEYMVSPFIPLVSGLDSCTGASVIVTRTVNPIPQVTPVPDQVVCQDVKLLIFLLSELKWDSGHDF